VASTAEPLPETIAAPTVTIGGIPADVFYSGLAPGFYGLYQVNAKVPSDVAPGDAVPVVLSTGGISSNTVTAAIE
jgi:minor extracellular serine protease Vpr